MDRLCVCVSVMRVYVFICVYDFMGIFILGNYFRMCFVMKRLG